MMSIDIMGSGEQQYIGQFDWQDELASLISASNGS
jgi:hypothetical protein